MQPRPTFIARIACLACYTLLLTACGNKGPLTLPPKAEPAKAAVTQPAPAPAAKPAADNNSPPAAPSSQ